MNTYFSKKMSKIQTLNLIISACNSDDSGNNKLIITTANGIYQGTLRKSPNLDDYTLKPDDDILTCYEKQYLSSLEDYEKSDGSKKDIEISENPIAIVLEDVDIITSVKNIHMPFVFIFVDQIIGFSMGYLK